MNLPLSGLSVIPNKPPFSTLGRSQYKLLGLENEEARVIRYAPLHRHSDYSLLDGMTQIPFGVLTGLDSFDRNSHVLHLFHKIFFLKPFAIDWTMICGMSGKYKFIKRISWVPAEGFPLRSNMETAVQPMPTSGLFVYTDILPAAI